ncbi:MAG: VOC family protein [Rhodospirillaceae bacterium]|nr:VOC family protein [Rhodospirillaceae bacterium]
MTVQLNHTIVWCRDQALSAGFLTDILGLPPARRFLHFLIVDLANGVSMDYYATTEPIVTQHYAFLVSDAEFDAALARVKKRELTYWADPARTQANEINTYGGGRGFYFFDPDKHLLEVITKPYPISPGP